MAFLMKYFSGGEKKEEEEDDAEYHSGSDHDEGSDGHASPPAAEPAAAAATAAAGTEAAGGETSGDKAIEPTASGGGSSASKGPGEPAAEQAKQAEPEPEPEPAPEAEAEAPAKEEKGATAATEAADPPATEERQKEPTSSNETEGTSKGSKATQEATTKDAKETPDLETTEATGKRAKSDSKPAGKAADAGKEENAAPSSTLSSSSKKSKRKDRKEKEKEKDKGGDKAAGSGHSSASSSAAPGSPAGKKKEREGGKGAGAAKDSGATKDAPPENPSKKGGKAAKAEKQQRQAKGADASGSPSGKAAASATSGAAASPAAATSPAATSHAGHEKTRDHRQAWNRVLVLSDLRGELLQINELAMRAKATAVITTGNFGFYDDDTPPSYYEKRLRKSARPPRHAKGGDLVKFLRGEARFNVPVYTVWGSHADVRVISKFRTGEYQVRNLHILDEVNTFKLGNMRLFGLGGSVDLVKFFDVGAGTVDAIAGKDGEMWTTMLQLGQLATTAAKCSDSSETRVLVSHVRASSSPLVAQMATALRCDVTVGDNSGAQCFSWFNDASVRTQQEAQARSTGICEEVDDVWSSVGDQVLQACQPHDQACLKAAFNALTTAHSDRYFRSTWHLGASSRRDISAVLLASENSVGLDTFASVVIDHTRNRHADRMWQSRTSNMKGPQSVIMSVDGEWSHDLSVGEVKNLFSTIGCRANFVVLPQNRDGQVAIEFDNVQAQRRALGHANLALRGQPVKLTAMQPRSETDDDWRRGDHAKKRDTPQRKTPCSFHRKKGGCKNGASCPFLHD